MTNYNKIYYDYGVQAAQFGEPITNVPVTKDILRSLMWMEGWKTETAEMNDAKTQNGNR